MSDLISRQETLSILSNLNSAWVGYEKVSRLPTIDAVPVVRCRDCKYYWKNNSKYKSNMEDLDDLMMCLASPKDEAFCSEGERKVDE